MAPIKKSISVETVLEELFSYLPGVKGLSGIATYKPTFMYGDQYQLLDFLRQNSGKTVYPLIWLVYPFEEVHERSCLDIENLTLVLAVETNTTMLNKERLAETFGKILMPLLDNIKHTFITSNVISTDEVFKITKFPNYAEDNEAVNGSTYVWDALKIRTKVEIKDNCVKPIFF